MSPATEGKDDLRPNQIESQISGPLGRRLGERQQASSPPTPPEATPNLVLPSLRRLTERLTPDSARRSAQVARALKRLVLIEHFPSGWSRQCVLVFDGGGNKELTAAVASEMALDYRGLQAALLAEGILLVVPSVEAGGESWPAHVASVITKRSNGGAA